MINVDEPFAYEYLHESKNICSEVFPGSWQPLQVKREAAPTRPLGRQGWLDTYLIRQLMYMESV